MIRALNSSLTQLASVIVKKPLQKKGILLGIVLLSIAIGSTVAVFQIFGSQYEGTTSELTP